MALTGIFMVWIFYLRRKYIRFGASVFVAVVCLIFLMSDTNKILHGGHWPIIIATAPFLIIMLYRAGQRKLNNALQYLPIDVFLRSYNQIYQTMSRIQSTALFFSRDAGEIPLVSSTILFMRIILSFECNAC
jgi:KUP system potassium uptake protein